VAAAFEAYRQVLADPRARAFSGAGFLARLPLSMTGIGIVLLVSLTTGSFGRAGIVAGVGTLCAAVAAPGWGRMMDRLGQARVLLTAATIWVGGLTLVIVSVVAAWPLGVTLVGSIAAGLGYTSAGAAVRARWTHRLEASPLLNTAYAVEAVVDEVIFIVGPVLVTYLATSFHPALGIVACLVLGLVGALLLAGQRSTQPPVRVQPSDGAVATHIRPSVLVPIAACCAALGAVFGGMEVAIVAFAREAGVLRYAGVILMVWALGSLVSGVVTGSIQWRATPARRFRVGAAALACSVIPLPFVHDPVLMAGLLTLSGLAIAPTMIASIAVTQASVPGDRLNEALGWTSTGLATGVAIGAAGIGQLVDRFSPTAAFWGLVGAGGLLLLAGLFVRGGGRVSPAPRGTPAAGAAPEPVDNPWP
jgi:MFS family permease